MIRGPALRLADVKVRIGHIRNLLRDKSLDELEGDVVATAALERFFEVISEASRHLPEEWRTQHPHVPWRQVADIGNRLRHGYDMIEPKRLWAIYCNDLDTLEDAIDALIVTYPG